MKRIYHTWDKWECYPSGFYEDKPQDSAMSDDECMASYAAFLRDSSMFEAALKRVIAEWKFSCEHYLSNERMNRIAWLGQASMCIARGVPSRFRGGFNMLSEQEQTTANELALKYLNAWLESRGEKAMTMDEAQSKTQVDLY